VNKSYRDLPRLTPEGSGHMVLCNDKVDRKFRVNKSRRSR
jgi:hypothetical protein